MTHRELQESICPNTGKGHRPTPSGPGGETGSRRGRRIKSLSIKTKPKGDRTHPDASGTKKACPETGRDTRMATLPSPMSERGRVSWDRQNGGCREKRKCFLQTEPGRTRPQKERLKRKQRLNLYLTDEPSQEEGKKSMEEDSFPFSP